MPEFYAQSGSVEWYTPAPIVASVVAALGAVDCDPCSNPPPYNVPATVHYTAVENGLVQPWGTPEAPARVFVNPPYGKTALPAWIAKLAAEQTAGHVTAALTLTPDSTDTRWFQWLWTAEALCFTRGRISFIGAKQGGNTSGSVLAYWGPEPLRFAAAFAQHGQILYPQAPPRPQARQLTLLGDVA